ncbi:hypothetical protein BH20ACT15_BH20ACT15_09130 [soil metagenome]
MGWLIVLVAILVVAYLLYMGNRSRQRRKVEAAREAEKLEAKVGDHRAMSADHQAKADELKEKADREMTKAARHEVKADELDPDSEARDDASGS